MEAHIEAVKKGCIIRAPGKRDQQMVPHCLDRNEEVAGVCREPNVGKLERFRNRITAVLGSDLDEGESEGLPVWSEPVGDSILKSNKTPGWSVESNSPLYVS